jgi:hypothetical protein
MAGVAQPGVLQQLAAFRQNRERFAAHELGFIRELPERPQPLANRLGDEAVAFVGGVNFVRRVGERRFARFEIRTGQPQPRTDVDHLPAIGGLRHEPCRLGVEHRVIALRVVGRMIGVIQRRRDEGDLGTVFFHRGFQLENAILIGFEAGVIEREVDPIIHSVTGEDVARLKRGEHALEALVQAGPRELAAGVALFGKPGDRLAGQAEIDDLGIGKLRRGAQRRFHQRRPAAVIGDAVAENCHTGRGGGRLQRKPTGDDQLQDTTKEVSHGVAVGMRLDRRRNARGN